MVDPVFQTLHFLWRHLIKVVTFRIEASDHAVDILIGAALVGAVRMAVEECGALLL